MLTPILGTVPGSPEADYTQEHTRTRSKIERLFGRLSGKWRSISRQRVLSYEPQKVAAIIDSCAILHNILVLHSIGNLPVEDNQPEEVAIPEPEQEPMPNVNGLRVREQLIQEWYD